jgi:hypothetical protein
MRTLKTHTRRSVRRIRESVADMNYAQRRLVEVNLGIPPEESRYRGAKRQEIDELEALYSLAAHEDVPARTELPPVKAR